MAVLPATILPRVQTHLDSGCGTKVAVIAIRECFQYCQVELKTTADVIFPDKTAQKLHQVHLLWWSHQLLR